MLPLIHYSYRQSESLSRATVSWLCREQVLRPKLTAPRSLRERSVQVPRTSNQPDHQADRVHLRIIPRRDTTTWLLRRALERAGSPRREPPAWATGFFQDTKRCDRCSTLRRSPCGLKPILDSNRLTLHWRQCSRQLVLLARAPLVSPCCCASSGSSLTQLCMCVCQCYAFGTRAGTWCR